MQAHPLIPPHIAPGCWPEATAEDKKNALANLKQQRMMQSGMESVVVKGAISAGAGFAFGLVLSLFSFGMAYDTPFGTSLDGKKVHWKTIMKNGMKSAVSQGRSFAYIGASYAVAEGIIESYRGKHDMQSAVGGGFAAGAFLARRNGSKAMLLGGAGFAGFSWAIEHFWIQKPPADDDNGFFVC